MVEQEYKTYAFFVRLLETMFPGEEFGYAFFRQFKPRYIWNRDTGKLERCIKVGDVGAYIASRMKGVSDPSV